MRKHHWGLSPSTWWAYFWVPTTREWGQCGLPHHFRTQPRPKAIPYNLLIQWIKAQICPKLSHEIGQIIYNLKHKRHQWKARNQRIVHLLVQSGKDTKMEAESTQWWPRVRKNRIPWVLAFLSEGLKFLGWKLHSPSLFKPFRAGGARPSELTLHFF